MNQGSRCVEIRIELMQFQVCHNRLQNEISLNTILIDQVRRRKKVKNIITISRFV
jgi:hypothetical protein